MEWKEFTAAIREGREPLGSGRDGLEANRMLAAKAASLQDFRKIYPFMSFAESGERRS
jgi:hypothetical protein